MAGIAADIPAAVLVGDEAPEVLVLGWGSTWGAIRDAVARVRATGGRVAHVHLTHLNPLPANLGELLRSAQQVLVPELNRGQLCSIVRSEYLVDARSLSKVRGVPFTAAEVESAIRQHLQEA